MTTPVGAEKIAALPGSEVRPGLGESRLFISAKQRRFLDTDQQVVQKPEVPTESVMTAPAVVIEEAPAIRPVKRTLRKSRLDGVVIRSDGARDVWVSGSLVNKKPANGVRVLHAGTTGPIVLGISGRRHYVYPGQSVYHWTVTPFKKRERPL